MAAQPYEVVVDGFCDDDDYELCRTGWNRKMIVMRPEYYTVEAARVALAHGMLHACEEEYGAEFEHRDLDRAAQSVAQLMGAMEGIGCELGRVLEEDAESPLDGG